MPSGRQNLLIALVAACTLAAAGLARAETPVNPLRSRAPTRASATESLRVAAAAWQDEGPETRVELAQAPEELPTTQPPTVVPHQFGQGQPVPGQFGPHPEEHYPEQPSAEQWPGHPGGRLAGWLYWPRLFGHSDPNDPYRHTGLGEPLIGTSWRNRPWYFGLFVGGILNDDLVANHVLQNNSTFLGARLGWDFDHYWGLEARYAYARAETLNGLGAPLPEPARDYYGDISLLYYPWGDARWRPYLLAGLGFANFRFEDDLGFQINDSALGIPLGFGLKHLSGNYLTLRLDFVDNITVGTNQLDSMHNVSLMAGAEFRFGGRSPSYFPWHGNTSYW